jgi:hypothetical protein
MIQHSRKEAALDRPSGWSDQWATLGQRTVFNVYGCPRGRDKTLAGGIELFTICSRLLKVEFGSSRLSVITDGKMAEPIDFADVSGHWNSEEKISTWLPTSVQIFAAFCLMRRKYSALASGCRHRCSSPSSGWNDVRPAAERRADCSLTGECSWRRQ